MLRTLAEIVERAGGAGMGMDRHYTLAEIGRITGIPLEELEQYERDFGDLLPRPHCISGSLVSPPEPRAVATSEGTSGPTPASRARLGAWRRLWQAWTAAARRVRWWPVLVCGARVYLWCKKWGRAFEPA